MQVVFCGVHFCEILLSTIPISRLGIHTIIIRNVIGIYVRVYIYMYIPEYVYTHETHVLFMQYPVLTAILTMASWFFWYLELYNIGLYNIEKYWYDLSILSRWRIHRAEEHKKKSDADS